VMPPFDPARDLMVERDIDVAPGLLWRCWTTPALLERWFCPVPWRATDIVLDLRPGGRFDTVIRGPAGETVPGSGCVVAVEHERLFAWTDALTEGFRPGAAPFMTGVVTFAPAGAGTRYRAVALHANGEARAKHEAMGFAEGWGKATEQMEALARSL